MMGFKDITRQQTKNEANLFPTHHIFLVRRKTIFICDLIQLKKHVLTKGGQGPQF